MSTSPVIPLVPASGQHAPESAEWWRDRLLAKIAARRPELDLIDEYVRGEHRMAFATSKYREAFGRLLRPLRDDWISVIAEAPVERLAVEGFRMSRSAGDETGDDAAWALWQENGLDARAMLAHDEAVKFGTAYVAVQAPDGDEAPPMVILPATRAAVEYDPVRPLRRTAGLHTWVDIDGSQRCRLWLPDRWVEWASTGAMVASWEAHDEGGNDIGVVPIVPLPNRPTLRCPDGQSDITLVIPVQDAINKLLADLMIASEFGAYRQRWMTGVEIPTDPETGEPLNEQFFAAISRILTVAEPDAKLGEFAATDLSNYSKPIELLVQHIAAQTRTPPHYLMGTITNVSSEALRAAETGLVSRVRAKQATFGEGWEEAIRLAFRWLGDDERAADTQCEVMWRDPETRTEGERVDALTKLGSQALAVPKEALWSRIPGVTPQEIQRWRDMSERDAVLSGLTLGVTPNGAPVEPPSTPNAEGGLAIESSGSPSPPRSSTSPRAAS